MLGIMGLLLISFIACFHIAVDDERIDVKKTLIGNLACFMIVAIIMVAIEYLCLPAYVGIGFGLFRVAWFPVGLTAVILIIMSPNIYNYPLQAIKILCVIIGVAIIVATPATHTSELYNLPDVEVISNFSEDNGIMTPTDINHVRLVSRDMAYSIGNKIIGESPDNLGSQFEVLEEDFHIQTVNNHLWWVAPLQFRSYWKWENKKYSPGFIMVDAEDPSAETKLFTHYQMKYMTRAFFGDELHRHIYYSGYQDSRITDLTFEVTDNLAPRWTVSILKPTVVNTGDVVVSVLSVDPETGKINEYDPENKPEWLDRVVPESLALDYAKWYGAYAQGWKNSWWVEDNVNEPANADPGNEDAELFLVYTGDNQKPAWFGGYTSPSASDQSLTSIFTVDMTTAKLKIYKVTGSTPSAVLDAVNSEISEHGDWVASEPIPYNIYGSFTYIVPVAAKTRSGYYLKKVAFVYPAGNNDVSIADTKKQAASIYKEYLFSKTETVLTDSSSPGVITGVVERINSVVIDGTSRIMVFLNDSDKLYSINPVNFPEASVTETGDDVYIVYDDTRDAVVTVSGFDNLDILTQISKEEVEFNVEEAARQEYINDTWVPQEDLQNELDSIRYSDE